MVEGEGWLWTGVWHRLETVSLMPSSSSYERSILRWRAVGWPRHDELSFPWNPLHPMPHKKDVETRGFSPTPSGSHLWAPIGPHLMLKAVPNKNAGFIILLTSIFTFFFFGEIRMLTTFTRLMDYNNGFSFYIFFLFHLESKQVCKLKNF
jgi:hypothetical protein